jgi:hypothetical protein
VNTKICTKCGIEKNIEEFPLRNQFTLRRQSYCKDCRKVYGVEWYGRNKEYQKANARKHSTEYRAAAKEYVWNYLLTHPCIQCGEINPVVLEFHHVRGEKENDIAHLINQSGSSLDTLIAELEKCDVLCANCHRKLTAEERGWFRSRK